MTDFKIEQVHEWWAEARAKRWGLKYSELIALLQKSEGKCQLSGVPLRFGEAEHKKEHPLFAELDHREPGADGSGHMIICRAFNRAKGRLPLFLFEALVATPAWSDLMKRWDAQAGKDPDDLEALNGLLWPKT